ncbi:MAG TPA: helix-turn-helix transcriptional regulator, partial [Firmicutes bacterium]|nr:helix-turn-helix transcriptional regulator [Bacillota bacterium]
MSNLAEIIGRNIEKMRMSRGISKSGLAELIEVSRPTLDGYLNGQQIIDSGKLAILAREFDKPLDFFLSSSNNRFPALMFRAGNASPEDVSGVARRFQLYAERESSSKVQ